MAKGFTVKAASPKAKAKDEWDIDAIKARMKGKAIVFCLPIPLRLHVRWYFCGVLVNCLCIAVVSQATFIYNSAVSRSIAFLFPESPCGEGPLFSLAIIKQCHHHQFLIFSSFFFNTNGLGSFWIG